ncbi:MAG: SprT-like family protein [Candidatus Kariarchaeaceae archaeon]|jgi:predicted SprT family Zn-dependent metalloprotease
MLGEIKYTTKEINQKTLQIYTNLLSYSDTINDGNFRVIVDTDLKLLFEQYNAIFFSGLLTSLLSGENGGSISCRISNRMTRTGGKTIRKQLKDRKYEYEIRISSPLLLQSFSEIERKVNVNGINCKNRIEALFRVFEHELIHLYEMLVWHKSSCSGKRFRILAHDIFGHKGVKHELVTQSERAQKVFQLKVGDEISFEYLGMNHIGIINRITKRATILVENSKGKRYSNGKNYMKYYVPLAKLRKKKIPI